jgi:hypothetical protein
VRFGNGINGVVPSGTISVRYKTGGGATGNVNAGTLTKLEGSFPDADGRPVSVSATNPRPATGGTERQPVAQIQALAPESIRVLNRTVSREDFEINARRLPAVARELMLTSNEDRGIAENTGILFVIPRGSRLPSQALKDAVKEQVTIVFPSTLTFQVAGPGSDLPGGRRAGDRLPAPGRQRAGRSHRHPEGARGLLRGVAAERNAEPSRGLWFQREGRERRPGQ